MRCKVPEDPEVYAQLITDLAYGVKMRLIGESLGVPESTVRNWKQMKRIRRDIAVKTLELIREPMIKVRAFNPALFLQTHRETREDFTPTQNVKASLELIIRDCVKEDG